MKKVTESRLFSKREGASHSLWMNPKNGVVEAVPRHKETKKLLPRRYYETWMLSKH